MSLSAEARARFAAQQAALVEALVCGGEVPSGFDATRISAAAASLLRKRMRSVARAWPGLARALGSRFAELFSAYAARTPLPRAGGPLADGRAFARWLCARHELPDVGRLQALAVDLRYSLTGHGLVPRRWPCLRIVWLREARRLILAFGLPWLGEYLLTLPLGRLYSRRASSTSGEMGSAKAQPMRQERSTS